jgi:hypothetical protein
MPLAKQVSLVFANILCAQLFGWAAEVPDDVVHRAEVGASGILRVIPTLEFLKHRLL